MAESVSVTVPMNFTLSRHELLVILDALGEAIIPGLAADPLGDLSPEQEQLAKTIAQRALLARGFMRMHEDGPALHRWILDAIATCAFAPKVIMAIRRSPNDPIPFQFYAHIGEDAIVSHIPSPDALHAFAMIHDHNMLVEQLNAIIRFPKEDEIIEKGSFQIFEPLFSRVREHIATGNTEDARASLTAATEGSRLVDPFIDTMVHEHTLVLLHWLHAIDEHTREERDFTVIHDGQRSWLLEANDGTIHIHPTSSPHFKRFFLAIMDSTP